MNLARIGLATLAATVAYFVLGGLFFTSSAMRSEFLKYPAVYRTQEDMKGVMPIGIVGMLLSMLALTLLYALQQRGASRLADGSRFGAIVALFALGAFVLHNHVNLNVGPRLTAFQGVAYSIQWLIVGLVIAFVYRP